jgi:hypothetical protein
MDAVAAFPMIDLGASGRIPVVLPALDLMNTMTRVPRATGQLASAKYDLLAQARDAADQPEPASIAWLHGVNAAGTVEVKSWLLPPTALSTAGGTFSFSPVVGATVHAADLNNAAGERVWSISIFDKTTSFTLPGVSPDPLPLGTVQFTVSAFKAPGANLSNFAFDDLQDQLTDLSSDAVTFTR